MHVGSCASLSKMRIRCTYRAIRRVAVTQHSATSNFAFQRRALLSSLGRNGNFGLYHGNLSLDRNNADNDEKDATVGHARHEISEHGGSNLFEAAGGSFRISRKMDKKYNSLVSVSSHA